MNEHNRECNEDRIRLVREEEEQRFTIKLAEISDFAEWPE
jgi:hypothetical protein